MNMMVSGILDKNGKKIAFARFEEDHQYAEGTIPDCKITVNNGFTDDEIKQLETYMQENLAMLKSQAAKVNPIKAMMNSTEWVCRMLFI